MGTSGGGEEDGLGNAPRKEDVFVLERVCVGVRVGDRVSGVTEGDADKVIVAVADFDAVGVRVSERVGVEARVSDEDRVALREPVRDLVAERDKLVDRVFDLLLDRDLEVVRDFVDVRDCEGTVANSLSDERLVIGGPSRSSTAAAAVP